MNWYVQAIHVPWERACSHVWAVRALAVEVRVVGGDSDWARHCCWAGVHGCRSAGWRGCSTATSEAAGMGMTSPPHMVFIRRKACRYSGVRPLWAGRGYACRQTWQPGEGAGELCASPAERHRGAARASGSFHEHARTFVLGRRRKVGDVAVRLARQWQVAAGRIRIRACLRVTVPGTPASRLRPSGGRAPQTDSSRRWSEA